MATGTRASTRRSATNPSNTNGSSSNIQHASDSSSPAIPSQESDKSVSEPAPDPSSTNSDVDSSTAGPTRKRKANDTGDSGVANYKGRKPGGQSFTKGDGERLLDAMAVVLPIGTMQWESCAALYTELSAPFQRNPREGPFLKDKFNEQIRTFNSKQTGSTARTPLCIRAKEIEDLIAEKHAMKTLNDAAGEDMESEEVDGDEAGLPDDDLGYHGRSIEEVMNELEAESSRQQNIRSTATTMSPFTTRQPTTALSSPAVPRITPILQQSTRNGRNGGNDRHMEALIQSMNNDHGLGATMMASTLEQRLNRVEKKKERLEEKVEELREQLWTMRGNYDTVVRENDMLKRENQKLQADLAGLGIGTVNNPSGTWASQLLP
ncbi:hypothetical protein BJ508DRAFT_321251 [Ascobolus immersus RN42]|uniref:Uncharacterized protein n=1 Tax=Ascobolus immersus RN42 TaxID=1160509 RepID=A0A3N4HVU1_ASCIM|nr:hypothetical protein BJ508DRAFT_329750 [Ascobolus immersus RN42]RPA87381.1 hypothetical protein BJ508DRAFT_321251 [Ascobolus immersus RN42]